MALHHSQPGEITTIAPYGAALGQHITHALFKSAQLEAIRIVLPAGKEFTGHAAPGDLTLQCIEGRVGFAAGAQQRELNPGDLLYVPAATAYTLRALEDASLLMILRLP